MHHDLISAVSVVFAGVKMFRDDQNIHVTISEPEQATGTSPHLPAYISPPQLKMPQTNIQSVPLTNP
jgi:hypothetical protein